MESKSFFFAGSAWGCIYYIGAYEAIVEKYNLNELNSIKWGGSSSGSLFALAAALNKSPETLYNIYTELSNMSLEHGTFGKMSIYHENALSNLLELDL